MRYVTVLFGLISSYCSYSQFEGKIIYESSYESLTEDTSSDELNAMLGTKHEYYISGDSYKSVLNGEMMEFQIFTSDEKRLYTKITVSDTLYWNDVTLSDYDVLSFKHLKMRKEILGYKCRSLEVVTEKGKTIYFYSRKLKLNSVDFVDHKYGEWALYTSLSKSLPLEITFEGEQFKSTSIATGIEKISFEKYFFAVPELPKQKSPF